MSPLVSGMDDCGHVCCPDPANPLHVHFDDADDCCSDRDTLLGVPDFEDGYDHQAEQGQGPPA